MVGRTSSTKYFLLGITYLGSNTQTNRTNPGYSTTENGRLSSAFISITSLCTCWARALLISQICTFSCTSSNDICLLLIVEGLFAFFLFSLLLVLNLVFFVHVLMYRLEVIHVLYTFVEFPPRDIALLQDLQTANLVSSPKVK